LEFLTASKRPPLSILSYFLALLQKEGSTPVTIRVDEDGALSESAEFTSFLVQNHLTMETTGGYASWLNGKIERPHRTIANKVRAMLYNSGLSNTLWCFAAESATDAYRYTYISFGTRENSL
jgi:hypothetical protein